MFIAVDFDGTIVEHMFPEIGPEVPGAFNWLKKFQLCGAKLVLWTMRSDGQESGDFLTDAFLFCRTMGVEFDFINENTQGWTTSPKVYAKVYIDDAAFGCPLIPSTVAIKPMVDWSIVGPGVIQILESRSA